MAAQSKEQKETVGRVMHEFKHGELESSTGKKVSNPKQAIAIALHEAGASREESDEKNAENLRKTKGRENSSETSRDEAEGTDKATGSDSASSGKAGDKTRGELYEEAKEREIPGRSKMSKDELAKAVEKG